MSQFRGQQADRALESLRDFYHAAPGPDAADEAARAARAEARVLRLFQGAARDVPAYRKFLVSHGVEAAAIADIGAFRRLPPTTKDSYYRAHTLPELCRHGQLDTSDMLALSTGSTGEPAVWPRFVSDEIGSAARFEQVLAFAFAARERRTLAVICFALGNWVGGLYTLVYPENVSVGLEQPEFASLLTGKFVLEVVHDAAQDAELLLTVELARGAATGAELALSIQSSVRRELERLNSEFLSYVPGARRTPRVELRALGDPEYFPGGVKHRYTR